MAVAETPIHTDFMDADMRLVWDGLGRAWPCETKLAAGILPGQDRTRSIDVARLLSGIPRHVSIDLGHRDHETIRSFAARLVRATGAAE